MNYKLLGAIAGISLAGTLLVTAWPAEHDGQPAIGAQAPQPPQGARAVVQLSPNPSVRPGEEITIAGNCGGGQGLREVTSQAGGRPSVLENVRIVTTDPNGFLAKANIARGIGAGVGAVFVDCGGEAGVALLVTTR